MSSPPKRHITMIYIPFLGTFRKKRRKVYKDEDCIRKMGHEMRMLSKRKDNEINYRQKEENDVVRQLRESLEDLKAGRFRRVA